MKKILITSTDMMMMQFLLPHVHFLREQGYDVEVACSNVGGRIQEVINAVGEEKVHIVKLFRNPIKLENFKGLKQLKEVINKGNYDLIWTNEPVMGVMTRLAAKKVRKAGTKVMYIVHGFHFFKGASKKNWLVFYPIEKLMSKKTDVLVTINKEDYERAKKLKCKDVRYIHGIGINTERLSQRANRTDVRKELNFNEDDFIVLSVGELNSNKNQETIINALGKIQDMQIQYVICGKGDNLSRLKMLVHTLGIEDNVHFLGYRKDVVDICSQSDVFVMPSKREGLPVASLEAMFCGLPLITSKCRGIVDVMEEGKTGYLHDFNDVDGFATSISKLKREKELRLQMGETNKERVKPYCIQETQVEVLKIIEDFVEDENAD